ncbi:hypothetical protein [Luteibacter sp. 22Crub2.1]|uniref:hypothetical protein n=1 Tax=Luteibacter sp. 22Crub2.1 TaxID=1283288 RepID=UPI0009A758B1|nr:hypothetical protein [Luteibacter sp. 22Crub2.1]SKB74008.1 hypothetical protein SAMN05660880_02380 [Luteibacter sp. 22Crub2.1]
MATEIDIAYALGWIAGGLSAALVLSAAWTGARIGVTSSKLPREGVESRRYYDRLDDVGTVAVCRKCGETVYPDSPGESVECDSCGYEGVPYETDDLDENGDRLRVGE